MLQLIPSQIRQADIIIGGDHRRRQSARDFRRRRGPRIPQCGDEWGWQRRRKIAVAKAASCDMMTPSCDSNGNLWLEGHQACVLFFGMAPAEGEKPVDGLGGADPGSARIYMGLSKGHELRRARNEL
jgi:hypothetical protein